MFIFEKRNDQFFDVYFVDKKMKSKNWVLKTDISPMHCWTDVKKHTLKSWILNEMKLK